MSRYASREAQDAEQAIRDVQNRVESNNYCADCGETRPEYVNLTIGTFICNLCTEVHRSISNRRIKDIYSGDLSMDDFRRLDSVGNNVANRKFLATWNPREVPEPDRRDKEALREFLWLKYEGSFKKAKPPAPAHSAPAPAPMQGGYRNDDRFYDDRGAYRREQELFREGAPQNPDRPRGYWASRYETGAQRMPSGGAQRMPSGGAQMRGRDDYYARGQSQAPPYPNRYRGGTLPDRFQPPQPAQLVPYGRPMRPGRSRYQEQGMPYEEYGSFNSEERDLGMRRSGPSRLRRPESGQDSYGFSDGDADDGRIQSKIKSSKTKSRSRRRKSTLDDVGNGYYSDEVDVQVEDVSRKSKKEPKKQSKKSSKSKRTEEEYEEEYDDDAGDFEDDEEEDREIPVRKSKRHGKKSENRGEKDRDSVVTVDVADDGSASGQGARTEFDLMSEWMGESKDTVTSQGAATPQNIVQQSGGPIPAAMQQAYATQMPMMPPPMSVYGGMMPLAGGGFMPMMPGFVPGMGMPGVPTPGMAPGMSGMPGMPGMPGMLPPGMAPPMPPGMLGGPGMPGQPPMGGPMASVMNGMQGLNLNQQVPQLATSMVQPPPPPPVGMPAGPAPGPPPVPPES